ncbi:hypothetical protein EJB05_06879, partial [Eragrostis curvula]
MLGRQPATEPPRAARLPIPVLLLFGVFAAAPRQFFCFVFLLTVAASAAAAPRFTPSVAVASSSGSGAAPTRPRLYINQLISCRCPHLASPHLLPFRPVPVHPPQNPQTCLPKQFQNVKLSFVSSPRRPPNQEAATAGAPCLAAGWPAAVASSPPPAAAMPLDLSIRGSAARKAELQTLAPVPFLGPPPPPPIPPTSGMYLPGPPPPGVLLPRPIVYQLNPVAFRHMDECRSRSLIKFMEDSGVVPAPEDERRRERVVRELSKIVMDWAKRVAYEQGEQYWFTTATLLTYGSYALGAYGPESDIDALCVGPCIASLQHHFFVVLRQMLEGRPEVSELHSIEGAKVPLMRFKFNGVLVDLPYVQLPVINAAEAMHAFDPRVLENVDGASWRCLSGVRVNRQITQLVPNMKVQQLPQPNVVPYYCPLLHLVSKIFKPLLISLFFSNFPFVVYSRNFNICCGASNYGQEKEDFIAMYVLLGFFAGIHLAILAAYVCRRHPNASINTLFALFFDIFFHWPWPRPVSLLDQPTLCRSPEGCSLMPIMLPCTPPEFCSSSITESTFNKIKDELWRGHALTKDTRSTDIDWSLLFAPFRYDAKYKCFLRIVLSAPAAEELRDWVGWVKSRFRNLLLKLESLGIYCDPDPAEQVDNTIVEPNVVFFWGLMYKENTQICTSSLKEDFMKSITNNIYGKEKCAHSDIAMSIYWPPQPPKFVFGHSVYSENLPPYMMVNQLMKQDNNAVG